MTTRYAHPLPHLPGGGHLRFGFASVPQCSLSPHFEFLRGQIEWLEGGPKAPDTRAPREGEVEGGPKAPLPPSFC